MARTRVIKPGFFMNEELAACDPLARLLFAGIWTLADREGRVEDRPRKIKAAVLPYDPCDVEALLGELSDRGFIERYAADGLRLIQVKNFVKHQQPHYKETASEYPPPPGHADSGVVAFGVPDEQRQRILERDGGRCVECGATDRLSIDHIVARSKGGSGEDDNLRTLCVRCNSAKGNRLGAAIPDVESTSDQVRPDVESTKVLDDPLVTSYSLLATRSTAPPTPPSRPIRPVPKPSQQPPPNGQPPRRSGNGAPLAAGPGPPSRLAGLLDDKFAVVSGDFAALDDALTPKWLRDVLAEADPLAPDLDRAGLKTALRSAKRQFERAAANPKPEFRPNNPKAWLGKVIVEAIAERQGSGP